MTTNRGMWTFALLGMVGGCAAPDAAGSGTGDAVESVVLTRDRGGAGFCPNPNQFIDATLTRDDARALTLDGTVFRAYVPESECTDAACLVTEAVGPLVISDADATRLGELAEDLRVMLELETTLYGSCVGERDPGCDPCVMGELVIDGVSHADDPCQVSPCRLYADRLESLERFIDGLAPPPG